MGFIAKWLWLWCLFSIGGWTKPFLVLHIIIIVLGTIFVLSAIIAGYIQVYQEWKQHREYEKREQLKIKRGYCPEYNLRYDILAWYLDSNKDRIVYKNNNEDLLQIKIHGKFVDSISIDEFFELRPIRGLSKNPEVRLKRKNNKLLH